MEIEKKLKITTGILELILTLSLLEMFIMGGSITLAIIMSILHITTLVITIKNKNPFFGSIVGLIAAFLSCIPIPWIFIISKLLHLIAGILILKSLPKMTESVRQ